MFLLFELHWRVVKQLVGALVGDAKDGTAVAILRPLTGKPIDRRDCYRMVVRIAKVAGIQRHISPHSLRHAAITSA